MHSRSSISLWGIWLGVTCLLVSSARPSTATDVATNKGEVVIRVHAADGSPCKGASCSAFWFDTDWRKWQPACAPRATDASGAANFGGLKITAHVVVIRSGDDAIALKEVALLDDCPSQDADIKLSKPVVAT